MPSQPIDPGTAEGRFRLAFERLKAARPELLPRGSPIRQNNVAREAGCDPSAPKKARFPALIREVQAYVDLHPVAELEARQDAAARRGARRSLEVRLKDAILQRDQVQSILASANLRIVELTEQNRDLQTKLDELLPPPAALPRRRGR